MSTASEKTFKPDSSQGDFWGGYMMDAWFYKVLAFFPITGFLGIDQLALRSPLTALLKLLVNIFFWGAWYIYDILQITMDTTFVAKYGMSTPYGQKGNGYRFFKDLTEKNVNEFSAPSDYNGGMSSTLLFLAYALLSLFLGFTGIPMMIAGDFDGGIIKLASNFLFGIPTIFYMVGQVIEYFSVGSIGKTNIPHSWPLYPWFTIFEDYPAVNLIGEEAAADNMAEQNTKYGLDTAVPTETLTKPSSVMVGGDASSGPSIPKQPLIISLPLSIGEKVFEAASMYPPIAAFQTITAAKGAVQATSDMAESAANVGKKIASAIEKRVEKDPDAVIDTLIGIHPDKPQLGGGLLPESSGPLDTILFGGILVLVLGGFAAAFFRKITLPKRKDDREYPRKTYERNDSPPLAGGI